MCDKFPIARVASRVNGFSKNQARRLYEGPFWGIRDGNGSSWVGQATSHPDALGPGLYSDPRHLLLGRRRRDRLLPGLSLAGLSLAGLSLAAVAFKPNPVTGYKMVRTTA